MRGTIYYKKWTHMPWWSRMYHIHNLSLTESHNDMWARYSHILDFVDHRFRLWEKKQRKPIMHWDDPMLKISDYDKMKFDFLKEIMLAFPNLALENPDFAGELPENKIYKTDPNQDILAQIFTSFFQHLRKGMTPQAATEITIKNYRKKLNMVANEMKATDVVSAAENGQPLLEYLGMQQLKETEFKTRRVARDKELFGLLKGKALKYDDDYEPNYAVVNENEYRAHLESKKMTPEKILSAERVAEEKQAMDNFISRSKALLWRYYDQVVKHDKVAGMSNNEVMLMVFNTPTALERHFAPFVRRMEEAGAQLSQTGELDLSNVKNPTIKRRLETKKDLIKFALMLRDMRYGHVHLQQLSRRATQLQTEIVNLNQETAEKFRIINEQDLKELADKLKLSKSETDDLLGFVYYQQHEREKQIVREPISRADLNIEGFLQDRHQRIDWNKDFKESIFERNLRLQADWLKEQVFTPKTTPQLRMELVRKLVDALQALRRTRYQFDKTAVKKASKIFFLEHMNIDFDEENIDVERLEEYFRVPTDVFVRDPREDHEYQRSKKATQKTLLVFNLEDPTRTGSHDGVEDYQGDQDIWDHLRYKPLVAPVITGSKRAKSVNENYIKAMQMTKEEKSQYIKDNHINQESDDPLAAYLRSRWDLRVAKRAKDAEDKKKAGQKKKSKGKKETKSD